MFQEILVHLGEGLLEAFQPLNMMMIFFGCLAGLFVGALPGRATEHPPDHAPIVRILEGGGLQVLRAAPVPEGPAAADARWRSAVVELPGRDPTELGAAERARLLELLRAWGVGSVPAPRVSPPVDRLLRWLR